MCQLCRAFHGFQAWNGGNGGALLVWAGRPAAVRRFFEQGVTFCLAFARLSRLLVRHVKAPLFFQVEH
jgi:hypothetical protein